MQLVEPICHGSRRHIIRSTWRYVEIQIPSGAPRHQGNHLLRLSNRLGSVALGVLECLVENTLNHRTDGRISCGREVLDKLTLIVTSLKHSLHLDRKSTRLNSSP